MYNKKALIFSAAGLNFGRLLGMVFEAENKRMFSRHDCTCYFATSAGCFIALALALDLSLEDIKDRIYNLFEKGRKFNEANIFDTIIQGLTNGYRLKSKLREEIILEILYCAGKDENYTFDDLKRDTGKELSFNVIDFETGKHYHLGYFTTSNLSIYKAILASSAIPTFFPPEEIIINGNKHLFFDGGVYDYFLIDVCDVDSDSPICNDIHYNGRELPEDYTLAFLTFSKLEPKYQNDILSITNRMFHIMQLSNINKLMDRKNVISFIGPPSSLSYFSEITYEDIIEEINMGINYIISL